MKFYNLLISFILISCNKITPIRSTHTGNTITLLTNCALCKVSDDAKAIAGEDYELSVDNGDIPGAQHRLVKGQLIRIENIYKVTSDGRGPWIGVKGFVVDAESASESLPFIYCWSSGSHLTLAPWEKQELVPHARSIDQVP